MHKKISSRLAIEIIFLFAVLLGGYTLISSEIPEKDSVSKSAVIVKKNKTINVSDDSCKIRAYEGEVRIHGWYASNESGWLFVVSDEDIKNLPNYDETEEYKLKNKKIRLVDATPQMEKKLKLTSEKKPQTITITGYVSRCEGIPLASIKYKDGIFRKFLNM
jgi:hypothetical protein